MSRDRLPVLLLAAALTSAAAGAAAPTARPLLFYVGTYTDTDGRGIYRVSFDPQTGALGAPVLAGEARNPSFLALHPSGRFLYAVSERDGGAGRPSGAVSAFAVDAATGDLTLLNQQPSEGEGPTHLTVDRAGRHVLVANYRGGTVAVLPVGPDGRLGPAVSVRVHEGRGPNAARQEKAHAHGIYLDAAQRFALAADLGADRIFVYSYDAASGALTPHGAAALPPGAGPRHLAFDRRERFLYSIDELSSTVSVFSYEAARGRLEPVQTVSTLPPGFAGENTAAELVFSADGRFLYASNRGHDSLAVFSVSAETGRLAPIGHVPAGGALPRHFALDPSGRFLLVAHQGSGTLTAFRLDPRMGLPTPVGTSVRIPKPVCVLTVSAGRS